MKLFIILSLMASPCWAQPSDHLILTQIVTMPDEAESFSIHNPTDSTINLTTYYVCDDNDYYKLQTEGNLSPSHPASGFTAKFPNISINSGDTLIIVLHSLFNQFYGSDFNPDLLLFGSDSTSMLETGSGSFGGGSNKINDNSELLILFSWDGDLSNPIKDVDYFLWGNNQNAIDKSGIGDYADDTNPPEQKYFETTPGEGSYFSRIGTIEVAETDTLGNGITGHDETSEDFRQSWQILQFTVSIAGCTDPEALNFDPDAIEDDGSCVYPEPGDDVTIHDIIHNCGDDMGESIECDGKYDLSVASAGECPLYEESVTTTGVIVDYFDITSVSCSRCFPDRSKTSREPKAVSGI